MIESIFAKRYRIIRQLGAGGMGVVLEAEDQLLNKRVAIKTVKKGVLAAEHVLRFQREATALASLNNPHLVPVYVFGITDDNEPYLVMGLEEGIPLCDLIAAGRIPFERAVKIFVQLCDAMQHAHDRCVLHRDLKPANILIRNSESDSPFAVIIDFGIAMVESSNSVDSLTKTGMLLGTPAYMSPEQAKGEEIDATSDIYALGCIMFEALTGIVPFSASSALTVLNRKSTSEAPTINEAVRGCEFPQVLEDIVKKSLALRKSDRYQSMADLRNDLQLFEMSDLNPKPKKIEQPPQPSKLPFNAVILLAVAFPLILSGALLAILWEPRTANTEPNQSQPSAKAAVKIDTPPIPRALEYEEDQTPILRNGVVTMPARATDALVVKWLNDYQKQHKRVSVVKFHLCIDVTGKAFEQCLSVPIEGIVMKSTGVTTAGIRAISRLPKLKTLILGNPKVKSSISPEALHYLAEAPSLKDLILIKCQVDESLILDICKIKNLRRLELIENSKVNDRCLEIITRKLPRLRLVALGGTSVTGYGMPYINRLKELNTLSLRYLKIHDSDVLKLQNPYLSDLDVTDTKVSAQGIAMLRQKFPHAVIRTETGRMSDSLAKEAFTRALDHD